MQVKTGDILSVRHHFQWTLLSFVQVLIRWITNASVDHTAMILIERDKVFVIEAGIGYGVRKMEFSTWINNSNKVVYYSRREGKFDVDRFRNRALLAVDFYDYDLIAIVQQCAYQIARRFKQHIKWFGRTANGRADEQFYCSELAAYCHDLDDWWKTTPGDLLTHYKFTQYA